MEIYSSSYIDVINLDINLGNDTTLCNDATILLAKKKDKLTMYYRKEINMLNTLDKRIAKIHFRNGFKERNVQVNTLNFFISKYFKKLVKIDFLNIDAIEEN